MRQFPDYVNFASNSYLNLGWFWLQKLMKIESQTSENRYWFFHHFSDRLFSDFMSILGAIWGAFGVPLGAFWLQNRGAAPSSFLISCTWLSIFTSKPLGDPIGYHFGTILKRFWNHFGNILKAFLNNIRRRPKSKDRRLRTKDEGRTTKDRRQRTKDQRQKTKDQRRRAHDQRPKTEDQRPKTEDQSPKTEDQGHRTNDQKPKAQTS